MTAMPGTFCAAMVTRNSGTAMLTSAGRLNVGIVNTAVGATETPVRWTPRTRIAATAATSAPGTAHCRAKRVSRAQVSTTGTASDGTSTTARTGAVHRLRMTPASMAPAMGRGIAAIARASHGDRPGDDDERGADEERADGGGPAALHVAGRDEQRRAGGRPGDADRHPVPQAEEHGGRGDAGAQREQAGGGLRRGRADGAEPGEHDGERARVADDRADQPGQDGWAVSNRRIRPPPKSVPYTEQCRMSP